MVKKISIAGERYGRLVAVRQNGFIQYPSRKSVLWECVCDCGSVVTKPLSSLRSGYASSCGCLVKEGGNRRTHGMSKTTEYHSWASMVSRCRCNRNTDYHLYGGRGIAVCERWIDSFENFISDMGMKPSKKHSIDRIDNNAGYSKENCRWATPAMQSRNKRNNRIIEFNGERKVIADWASDLGINFASLLERMEKWPLHRALTQPKRKVGTKN